MDHSVVVHRSALIPRGQTPPFWWKKWLDCCKRLLYLVEYLRPWATISRWTTFQTGCCNCAI